MLALTGCAGLPNARTAQFDGHTIEFAVSRHDTVPVVFENGLDGRMEWWQKVIPALASDTTTLAYNRPGYGASTPVSTPRDAEHIVEDLRALLRHQGLNPPYVLVGHSFGGLTMQWFTRRYPDEVHALVLVDSTHPRQLEGAGALDKQSLLVRGLLEVMITGVAREELDQLRTSGQQVLALPSPPDVPVLVLSAAEPLKEHSPLAQDVYEKRRDIARLYPGSRQIWVDSGHGIPLERPDAVVAAIREALALPRRRARE